MNLYLISQTVNNDYGTYYAAVVCAESEDDARSIHPDSCDCDNYVCWDGDKDITESWCDKNKVTVKLIGTAILQEKGVILTSYCND